MPRFSAITLAAASLVLGACAHSDEQLYQASRAHLDILPVKVTNELRLHDDYGVDRLTPSGEDAVRRFAADYRRKGAGPLVISRPHNDASEAAALRLAGEVRAVLLAEGVDPGQISEGAYEAFGSTGAPTLLTFAAWEVQTPNCPSLSEVDIADMSSNSALPSFGCTTASNLAAMIANPGDLAGMRKMDPVEATHRTSGAKSGGASSGGGSAGAGGSAVGN